MTHGELFAGISGFGEGFRRSGIETLWHVEIDRDCRKVLRRHYPDALLLDDVRECGAHNLPRVDIISFGSPCQDLSVAGKRAGLEGERSGLFYEAIRIVRELRPAYALWENVPGALSSNSGRDFGAALDALADAGALDIGWAVLDAQWFGVAQRRRRVFLVADFRGKRAAQILSIPYGSEGNPPPSREARARVAASLTGGSGVTGNAPGRRREDDVNLVAACLESHAPRYDYETETLVASPLTTNAYADRAAEESNLVCAHETGKGFWTEGLPGLRAQPGGMPENLVAHTLRAEGADASEDGTGRGVPLAMQGMSVRRLTPKEAEKLQGFPPDWTAFDAEGKPISDSARYRMLGNAVAVPVTEWLGKRIAALEAQP